MLLACGRTMPEIREADLPRSVDAVGRLWLEYLTWGNDGLESRYGFRLPVQEAVEHDLATIAKFQPPDGRLLLAFEGDMAVGTACMRRIGSDTAEIKRMYVQPAHRGGGMGRALLDQLIAAARTAGYECVRLDSPDFMTAAHGLYRSNGFVQIEPYPESEIPDEYKPHWVFMERALT
ncbi:MAG: GNAT family N-acetyltransferase [Actinomycetota bacterium]|nr:GNAT family N-acetyltransferase [Actinomycetota bacterium]